MKTEKKYKTPEYTRRAIDKYNSRFARFTISTPHDVKDRLNAVLKAGESANALINDLLLQEIERREAADTDLQEAKPQEAPQGAASGARTNRHEAAKSRTEGRTEAQEGKTSAGATEGSPQEEPKPRGRSRKASGAKQKSI